MYLVLVTDETDQVRAGPSSTYKLFEEAIRKRRQIVCVYDGCPREVCPVILGHSDGEEKALTFQFAGESKSGLPAGGEWRCLYLSRVGNVRLREGPWRVGTSHTRPQGCVREVDIDANPDSPYRPKRAIVRKSRRPKRW
ncbi:MAG TPA: hypothetical protein VHA77_03300 [Xanthobacteraceae bacterium]|jgi:hypothetical protein|nr:hypothetical protein [Xanthobacteraceae bacterium]